MSRSVWILLLLLALWIFLGLYLWSKRGDNSTSVNAGPCVVAWELLDSNDAVIAGSDATINFEKSTSTIYNLDTDLKNAINQIGKYLNSNKGNNITIEGFYDNDEKPGSEPTLRDLAVARANKVKQMLTKAGASPSQLSIIAKMYDKENEANSDCLTDNTLNRGVSFIFGRLKGSE